MKKSYYLSIEATKYKTISYLFSLKTFLKKNFSKNDNTKVDVKIYKMKRG